MRSWLSYLVGSGEPPDDSPLAAAAAGAHIAGSAAGAGCPRAARPSRTGPPAPGGPADQQPHPRAACRLLFNLKLLRLVVPPVGRLALRAFP